MGLVLEQAMKELGNKADLLKATAVEGKSNAKMEALRQQELVQSLATEITESCSDILKNFDRFHKTFAEFNYDNLDICTHAGTPIQQIFWTSRSGFIPMTIKGEFYLNVFEGDKEDSPSLAFLHRIDGLSSERRGTHIVVGSTNFKNIDGSNFENAQVVPLDEMSFDTAQKLRNLLQENSRIFLDAADARLAEAVQELTTWISKDE